MHEKTALFDLARSPAAISQALAIGVKNHSLVDVGKNIYR
jgi:hypothetical protein